jgi:hypothetical protein
MPPRKVQKATPEAKLRKAREQAKKQDDKKAKKEKQENTNKIHEVCVQAVREGLTWTTPSKSGTGHFSLGQTLEDKLAKLGCKKRRWTRYRHNISAELTAGQEPTQPKPPGGRRDNNPGRQRVAMDDTKGNHVTKEDSKERQKEMAYKREKQQHLDYTQAELEYRTYIFAPFLLLLVPIIITYTGLQSLAAVASKIFDRKPVKYETDTTLITDIVTDQGDSYSGQTRTILFPFDLQLRKEKVPKAVKGIYSNRVALPPTFWAAFPAEEALIQRLKNSFGDILRQNPTIQKVAQAGYPLAGGNVEIEILKTESDTVMQHGHQDTCQNTTTVFLPLAMGPSLSTWVAKADTDFSENAKKPIEYEQFLVPCTDEGIGAYCNHAAWIHKGPGNPASAPTR